MKAGKYSIAAIGNERSIIHRQRNRAINCPAMRQSPLKQAFAFSPEIDFGATDKRDEHINERGMAMVIAMLVLVIVTVVGIAASKTSVYDTITALADKRKRTAFYAAEAGLEHAKVSLSTYIMEPIMSDTNPNPIAKWKKALFTGTYKEGSGFAIASLTDKTLGDDNKYTYTVYARNNRDGSFKDADDKILPTEQLGRSIDVDGEIILRSESKSTIEGGGKAIVETLVGSETTNQGSIWDKTGQFGHGTGKSNTGEDVNAVEIDSLNPQATGLGVPSGFQGGN